MAHLPPMFNYELLDARTADGQTYIQACEYRRTPVHAQASIARHIHQPPKSVTMSWRFKDDNIALSKRPINQKNNLKMGI